MDFVIYTTEEPLQDLPHYQWHYKNVRADLDHGFYIYFDHNYHVYIDTLRGYNDFDDIDEKVKSISELKDYLLDIYDQIEGEDNLSAINDLLDMLNNQLKEVA